MFTIKEITEIFREMLQKNMKLSKRECALRLVETFWIVEKFH